MAKFLCLGGACILLAGVAFSGCRDSSTPKSKKVPTVTGSTMGTYYRVIVPTLPAGMSQDQLRALVSERLERVDALMSTYKRDSEVSRFNRARTTGWFPVSTETATVVAAALEVFSESDGAFDITVAPLVDLWGFGPERQADQLPRPDEVREMLDTIGSRHLHVRLTPPALRKDRESLEIDLSGIAKGFAVDAIAEALEGRGLFDYLIDIGGEMRARGKKEMDTPWQVAIERPTATQRGIQTTFPLRDLALATSGDYRNYFEVDGQRYSHAIDPRTGQPIRHSLVSVSVLDPSCMRADAWATALIVLGPEEGNALAAHADLPAFLIVKDGPGFRTIATDRFRLLHSAP